MKAAATAATLLLAGALTLPGRAAEEPPPAHPGASLAQSVGVCELEIHYSRPSARGRAIWGEAVPWGEVWPVGDGGPGRIEFSHPARVQGQPIAAGAYALFAIPGSQQWMILFLHSPAGEAEPGYDPGREALRVPARPREAPYRESLEISLPEVGIDTARVEIHWERVAVPFDVTFDVRAAAAQAAREFVASATPADGRGVWNWANFFYQSGYNTAEALTWASDLAAAAPMYFTFALKARLLAANGRTEEAIDTARQALERLSDEFDQPGVQSDAEQLAAQIESWQAPSPQAPPG